MRISKKRKDVVSYNLIYNLKEKLKLKQKDLAILMDVSNRMLNIYEEEGLVPLLRFQAIINALKLDAQQKYQERIKLIDDIINSDD